MKIRYLNPQFPDLSLKNQPLLGTSIELIACATRNENEVISAAKGADAILTIQTPIGARVAEELERCKVIVRLGVG